MARRLLTPHRLLDVAAQTATGFSDDRDKIRALVGLARYVQDEPLRDEMVRDALRMMHSHTAGDWRRDKATLIPTIAEMGHVREALDLAAGAGTERAAILEDIASSVPPEWLSEVEAAARVIDDRDDRVMAQVTLSGHLPPVPWLPRALRTSIAMRNDDTRYRALSSLVPRLDEDGLLQVLAAATGFWNGHVTAGLVVEVARRGGAMADAALEAARAIESSPPRGEALTAIVPLIPAQGRTAVVEEALHVIPDAAWQVKDYFELTHLAPHVPDALISNALAAARGLDEDERASARAALAARMAELGRVHEAREVAQSLEVDESVTAYVGIIPFLDATEQARFVGSVTDIFNAYSASQLLAEVASRVHAEVLEDVLRAATRLNLPHACVNVARRIAPRLDPDRCLRCTAIVAGIEDPEARLRALTELISRLDEPARAGPIDIAWETLPAIGSVKTRAQVMLLLAGCLADPDRQRLSDDCVELALSGDAFDAFELSSLAEQLMKLGAYRQARRLVDAIQRENDRLRLLTSVVAATPKEHRSHVWRETWELVVAVAQLEQRCEDWPPWRPAPQAFDQKTSAWRGTTACTVCQQGAGATCCGIWARSAA